MNNKLIKVKVMSKRSKVQQRELSIQQHGHK